LDKLMKFTRETTLELAKIQREKLIQQAINFVGRLSEEAFFEIENSKIVGVKSEESLDDVVTKILEGKLHNLLKDAAWRIKSAADGDGKITAEMLNISKHLLTGYTITDNSPTAGKIAWADLHIVYKGTDYTITDGNTDLKYSWWDYSATPNTVLQSTGTKPTMTEDDILVFINESGVHHTVMSRAIPGAALLDSSVTQYELGSASVVATKIADGAVTEGKVGALAISSGKLADLAVLEGKIGSLAVTEAKLAALAVATGKMADLAVTEGKLAAGAVTAAKVGDGVISTKKLNLTSHFIY